MITIGLTGWSDHDLIQHDPQRKLQEYAGHFPVVELDTSFYAIPKRQTILNWIEKTPEAFQFFPKAYGVMTLHKPFEEEFTTMDDAFEAYLAAFQTMLDQDRVKAFLFQFPPNFDCVKKHVTYLRYVKSKMQDLPMAIEFRNPSWFSEKNKERTLAFLKEFQWTNVVVDQPQTPNNSVPKIPEVTAASLSVIRLHGRNYEGWLGENVTDWRAERTLYDYSTEELEELSALVKQLNRDAEEVCVIFNNNSGGHAAKNAKSLQQLLGLDFSGLAPKQLDLF
ncbi:DUF72 domain-containing protein [Alkalibacterium sp. f15]|uniref:DUF72 domain-containing protein n=1 Tax=Alkalibacterium sp. f15 TaxID=3414029 RepID=UPI003BF88664